MSERLTWLNAYRRLLNQNYTPSFAESLLTDAREDLDRARMAPVIISYFPIDDTFIVALILKK